MSCRKQITLLKISPKKSPKRSLQVSSKFSTIPNKYAGEEGRGPLIPSPLFLKIVPLQCFSLPSLMLVCLHLSPKNKISFVVYYYSTILQVVHESNIGPHFFLELMGILSRSLHDIFLFYCSDCLAL